MRLMCVFSDFEGKIYFLFLSFYLLVGISANSQNFSWNGTYSGTGQNRTYTSPTIGGITMTATIENSQNTWYSQQDI